MEPWPIMAWGLMLTAINGWIKTAQSRDFTEKDIILLHPSTTQYPGGFKCFTCEDATDNYECNRWAPDLYCPKESRYCYTHHKMSWNGTTVTVKKHCVALEDCLSTGCTEIDHEGNKVCTACCEGNICNMPLPRNETDAIFATTSPINESIRLAQSHMLLLSVCTISLMLHSIN
ncbi:ly6/PLAUR domain-containing protein 6-like [Xyrauchen texanus]|uniref:ly6/PLAUR domain-containing protein 6-like n=1 Tax=Xyrauchen texanus TaxID=154827 RepID=UPI0022425028|nr:ly6/PLAUR domain-containing protein 6-like [Xyrauchen texanus]XP_052003976.1 ly6/PLAUR domain-containing protein 6-like [Xyrauchen texanus]